MDARLFLAAVVVAARVVDERTRVYPGVARRVDEA